MSTAPEELHALLGAYVLGGLSETDHRAFTEHLRTCAACQAELGQISGLPRLLDLAGPTGGPHLSADGTNPAILATGDDEHLASLLSRAHAQRRTRRRWLGAVAAAAAVLLFGAGMWLGPLLDRSGSCRRRMSWRHRRPGRPSGSTSPS